MAKKRYLAAGMLVYTLLIAVFSTYDLSFSVRMTDGASALLIEAGRRFGPVPSLLIPAFCIRTLGEFTHKKWTTALVIMLCIGAGYSITIPALNDPIALVLCAMISALLYKLIKMIPSPKDTKKNRTILWIGILTVLAGIILIQLMKYIWGRPRYRAILLEGAEFRSWLYIEGFDIRDDLYRSFPSAHSFSSASSFMLLFLPDLYEDFPFKRIWCLLAAVLFTGFTMFSRIVAGMHFISDVMAGTGLYLLFLLIAVFINWETLYGKTEKTDSPVHDGPVRE